MRWYTVCASDHPQVGPGMVKTTEIGDSWYVLLDARCRLNDAMARVLKARRSGAHRGVQLFQGKDIGRLVYEWYA